MVKYISVVYGRKPTQLKYDACEETEDGRYIIKWIDTGLGKTITFNKNEIPMILSCNEIHDNADDGSMTAVWYSDEEISKTYYRSLREPLLEAFDKWDVAVLRGRREDNMAIKQWYKDILDLKPKAFSNIPTEIQYYLK